MITDLWLIDSSANTRSALHILSYKCNMFIDRMIFVSDAELENVKSFTRNNINKPDFTPRKPRK